MYHLVVVQLSLQVRNLRPGMLNRGVGLTDISSLLLIGHLGLHQQLIRHVWRVCSIDTLNPLLKLRRAIMCHESFQPLPMSATVLGRHLKEVVNRGLEVEIMVCGASGEHSM
jgi:hypothetical protein